LIEGQEKDGRGAGKGQERKKEKNRKIRKRAKGKRTRDKRTKGQKEKRKKGKRPDIKCSVTLFAVLRMMKKVHSADPRRR
jgi:hypothetical protein